MMIATLDTRPRALARVPAPLLRRARAEFLEMPGLCLTSGQARRLWNLPPATCDALLAELTESGFLRCSSAGRFVLAVD